MNESALLVQPVVALRAASLGAQGRAWLTALPGLVAGLERRWSLRVERSLAGGTAAYVAQARTEDGGLVVLKVSVPDPHFADEIGTLLRARGQGYVQLLQHAVTERAMVLEALGDAMSCTSLEPDAQLGILCRLLATAWAVPRAVSGPGAQPRDKATGLLELVERLRQELDHSCPERVLDQALQYARQRAAAFDPRRCVPLHGDAAPANALQVPSPRPGAESGFVFVDPDGFLGDPAYDLGVALRDWCPQLLASPDPAALARRYCALLATGSGVNEREIWEWGYLERVSTGLYASAMGAPELGRPFLETAELLLG